MRGADVVAQVKAQRKSGHYFIKWWRKDSDIVDFELIDAFVDHVEPEDIIDGFELLDMESMWELLTRLNPDTLMRGMKDGEPVFQWAWVDKDGSKKTTSYPFTPEAIMELIETEFFA